MDTIQALRVAATVRRTRGFSAAARELGLTPAAVSKIVGGVETRLGLRLFERSTRHLKPTEEGLRLLDRVEAPLRELQEVLEEGRSSGPARGVVKVSMPSPLARLLLLPHLGAFIERHPGVELDLRLENRRVDLVAEGYDCAIGSPPSPESRLVARPIATLRPILCASPGYLAAHGTPADLAQLKSHRLIALRSETSGRVRDWSLSVRGHLVSFTPRGTVKLTDPESVAAAAVAGCGIALVGLHHAAQALRDGRLRRVLPDLQGPRFSLVIYYPRRTLLAPRTRAFIDHVLATAPKAAYWQELRAGPLLK